VKKTTVTVPRGARASSSRMAGGTPAPHAASSEEARSAATTATRAANETRDRTDDARALLFEITSQGYDTRADQVREPLALVLLEHRVDARESERDGVTKAFCGLHAQIGAFAGARLAELRALDGIGERAHRASIVDLRLRALGLELVEDARQHRDLRLGEVELVREEAQRPSHAEDAAVVARSAGSAAEAAAEAGSGTMTMTVTAGSVTVRRTVATASGATKSAF